MIRTVRFRSNQCSVLNRGQHLLEELINGIGVSDQEHMSGFWDDGCGLCKPHREDFIAAAMDMEHGMGDCSVLPFENGAEGPADKAVIAGPDHLAHEASAGRGAHPDGMFYDRGELEEAGGDELAEMEGACEPIKFWQLVRCRNAADQDSTYRRDALCNLYRHNTAERKSGDDKGFGCIDLLCETKSVIA